MLTDETDVAAGEPSAPARLAAGAGAIEEAARLLNEAERPVVWAGGGVLRSGAWDELAELARTLDAPVATTYMGKGAFPSDDGLSAGSSCDEGAYRDLLADADVVLAVGTELGAETTAQYALDLTGQLIHLDAAAERIGSTYPALAIVGDARATLVELLPLIQRRADGAAPCGPPRCANGSPTASTSRTEGSSVDFWRRSEPRFLAGR